jgi:hypothetical protein
VNESVVREDTAKAEARLRHGVVGALARHEPRLPPRRETVAQRDLPGVDSGDRAVVEVVAAVVLRVEAVVEALDAELVIGRERDGELSRRAAVLVAVAIGVVGEVRRVHDRVEAGAAARAHLHCALHGARAARRTGRELPRVVRAVAHARARLRRARRGAREHLDDAADRVGAVQARRGSAQDLDALDLVERDGLERRRARRSGRDAQPVDQHQRLRRVGATQEHARRAARPAVLHDLDAGLSLQELGEALRAAAPDLFGIDDGHVGEEVGDPLGHARRGDGDAVEGRDLRDDRQRHEHRERQRGDPQPAAKDCLHDDASTCDRASPRGGCVTKA